MYKATAQRREAIFDVHIRVLENIYIYIYTYILQHVGSPLYIQVILSI
jgi:hypothetical protein